MPELWLIYQALKFNQWEDVNGEPHDCPYCSRRKEAGHHKDCMLGNAFAWFNEKMERNRLIVEETPTLQWVKTDAQGNKQDNGQYVAPLPSQEAAPSASHSLPSESKEPE